MYREVLTRFSNHDVTSSDFGVTNSNNKGKYIAKIVSRSLTRFSIQFLKLEALY